MKKIVLSEIDLHYGKIDMPKGFEIDRDKLQKDILLSNIKNCEFPFSKEWDKLTTYLREHMNVEYNFTLVNKETWGNVYKPKEASIPLLNIEPVDLKNSPDYTLLYGVKVENCSVRIHYDQNRRAGRSWDIELKNNHFIMFPSTQMYYITNNQKDSLNFILTTTYEYIG
tara:strand:+ start:1660 stop:2166 length:507 start_codon:yes stop_codon:yes gene_type:complete